MIDHKLTDSIFRKIFEESPSLLLVITPDFRIATATKAFLGATMTTLDSIVGQVLFDVFPDNPDRPEAKCVEIWRTSLERVLATRSHDHMTMQRYDIRRPSHLGGGFVPRYWNPMNKPLLDDQGNVALIIHQVEDVSELFGLREQEQAHARVAAGLRASNDWFITTLQSIGDAVITTDIGDSVVLMNPVAESLTGWPNAEAIGKPLESVFRIINGQTRVAVTNPVEKVLASGGVVGLANHTILIARDGIERPIEDSAAPIRDAAGNIAGIVLVFRDATERVRMVRELSDARLRLENALSAGSVGTFTWDIVNDRFAGDVNLARFYSIPPERINNAAVSEYFGHIHPDDRDWVGQTINDAVANRDSYYAAYRLIQPDGTVMRVITQGAISRNEQGQPLTMSGIVMDVTERERANEAIRESEERFRGLYNSIDAGFFAAKMIYDDEERPIDYRYLAVNPAFEQQTKWSNATGKTVCEFAPNLESYWFDIYDGIIKTGEPIRFENSVEALECRYFEVYGYRIGQSIDRTFAVLFNDITPRKRAEQEREHLVEQLRDAGTRKDEFLAMLSHELRNPLGAISSGFNFVQTVQKPELLAEVRQMMQHQITHLTRLVDDLLDVSRITQNKIELKKTTVELAAVINQAVKLVEPQLDEKRHELTLSLPHRPVRFVADPTRIEQMLSNLLTNAAKYSDAGKTIWLSAAVEGEQIAFRVRDQGYGISAEMLPIIFGLFTQADATLDRSRGGLGIGLTLVKSLAEMHGGSVTASSEGKGKGAEFILRIPIGQPDNADPANKPQTPLPTAGIARVLLIDDNRKGAKLTALVLENAGFEVETAFNGPDGLELARRFRPAVVLLDIGLPGMDGYEVASQIRHEEFCKDVQLIALTGYGEDKARERSKAAGFDHHLTKPLDLDLLMNLIGSSFK